MVLFFSNAYWNITDDEWGYLLIHIFFISFFFLR